MYPLTPRCKKVGGDMTPQLLWVRRSWCLGRQLTLSQVHQLRPELLWCLQLQTTHNYNNRKSHKYVCITPHQPDTESNPNANHTTSTTQHATVNIQLNIVTCPTCPDKFIRNILLYRLFDFRV